MCALAQQHRRFGIRRLLIKVRQEGFEISHNSFYALYRREGLQVRNRRQRRVRFVRGPKLPPPTAPNQRWSLDFMHDRLATGRKFRILTIVDDFSRESPAIDVAYSMPTRRVIAVLEQLAQVRGLPRSLKCDNGTEFTSYEMLRWAGQRGIQLEFIDPGKPTQNAYIESFNRRVRDECLDEHSFESFTEAEAIIRAWHHFYNFERPHSAIGYKTPAAFIEALKNEMHQPESTQLTVA
jgi:putative transposase